MVPAILLLELGVYVLFLSTGRFWKLPSEREKDEMLSTLKTLRFKGQVFLQREKESFSYFKILVVMSDLNF